MVSPNKWNRSKASLHLNPALHVVRKNNKIPVIFLTAQKSMDNIITMITKLVTKLFMKKSHMKYKKMAADRKNKWKNTANGCLK